MIAEVRTEITNLIDRLRQMQDKADALMIHQHDLTEQLQTAELKARESHLVTR